MTYTQYCKKKDSIARSSADVEVKVRAMEELDRQFYKRPGLEALKQIEESKPDISDIGGH